MTKTDLIKRLRLLPYQSAFAANDSRFKIGLWARQTGKDHTCTAEAVIDCIHNPGTTWIILAASERQALESLSKAKDWADILQFRIHDYHESFGRDDFHGVQSLSSQLRLSRAEITWSNGSRLLALPANPQTVRGYSANLILTEFAFHENADAIWRAIYPSISNPLRGGLKKLRIISTPNGQTNKFAHLWVNAPTLLTSAPPRSPRETSSAYFKSKITIHDAIKSGLPLDAAELQAGLNDPDAWSQEYLCEFMDSSSVMFPYDLIASCESESATESNPQLSTLPPQPQLYAGIDFGRKNHLTVCWILERVPNPVRTCSTASHLFITREVLCLKNTSTPDQLEILRPRLRHCRKICLDYTGAGIGLGDYLLKDLVGTTSTASQNKIELCQFTNSLKSELFPRLRAAFEQRHIRIPISRDIREDLHAIQRTVTQSGQITYRAPQTADGHSDRTTALALALRAATSAPASFPATTIYVPGRSADLRWAERTPRTSRMRTRF